MAAPDSTTVTIPDTFRAYQYEEFGDALTVVKLNPRVKQQPLQPKEVRIKIHSAALNPADYKYIEYYGAQYSPAPPSEENPFRVGFDLAGTVVEVGVDAKNEFQVGDEVYAMAYIECQGAFAEYIALDIKYVTPKPKNLSFNEAAGVPMVGLTSWYSLVRYGKVKQGDRVLVLGGSSGCGAFGIQIAKAFGAHVIATTSFRNTELVKSLGADQVIDYTKEKWVDVLDAHSIDIIYDCGVEPNAWNDEAQKVLKQQTGRFVTIEPITEPIESRIGATLHRVLLFTESSAEIFKEITKLVEAGKITVPIDSVHPFENLLEAFKIQKSNHAKGKIILQVINED